MEVLRDLLRAAKGNHKLGKHYQERFRFVCNGFVVEQDSHHGREYKDIDADRAAIRTQKGFSICPLPITKIPGTINNVCEQIKLALPTYEVS